MSGDFYRTGMGMTFFNGTMPKIADALGKIAKSMEASDEADIEEYKLLLELKFKVISQGGVSPEVHSILGKLEELKKK